MDTVELDSSLNTSNQYLSSEVLELGKTLFELALGTKTPEPEFSGESNVRLTEELQMASREFFTALQLLLRIEA